MPWVTKMHCTQCGTLVGAEAKFCAKCGSPISEAPPERTAEASVVPVAATKPRIFWVYFVAVLLFFIYAAMFIPAMSGQTLGPKPHQASMLGTSLLFYLSWRRLGRKGWHGALIGAGVGLLVSGIAAVISGFMRHGGGG
jgi:peptidoglycan/LPS O-acetylase OafA/YrhL